jgi:hypothetical protein
MFIICSIVCAFLIATAVASLTISNSPKENFIGSCIFAAFGFVDAVILFVIPRYFIDRSNFKYERMYVGTQHTTINESGLSATYEFAGQLLQWKQLGKIKEKKYNFYFYTSGKQSTFLPKIDMKKEDVQYVRKLIRQYADPSTKVMLRRS